MSIHSKRAMSVLPRIGLALFGAAVCAAQAHAQAQPLTYRLACNNHGPNWAEPVGDREGHTVQVAEGNCVVQGGPLDGAVLVQQSIWEFDKGTGTMLSSHGVNRKPGAMAAYTNTAGTLTFQMADGRITGWTASGKGRSTMASGMASALAGKTYSWTARPTGPRTYVIDVVYD